MTTLMETLAKPELIVADPLATVRALSAAVNRAAINNFDDPEVQKLVLYALENKTAFGEWESVVDSLVFNRGLFPYMDMSRLSQKEMLSVEAHRPDGIDDIVFHQDQTEIYLRLMKGESVILSAPTSFGKSLLIDAVIASGKFNNIAVIVPTIALIDETRRRLFQRFGSRYKVITHSSQGQSERNVFVMTQERVLDFEEMPEIDFFVIDEFYKLDPRRDSDRALLLNHAFYRLLKTGAQFYMLGPNILNISEQLLSSWRSTFVVTPYATVVSELISVSSDKNSAQDKLLQLCGDLDEPTLIYCASPASARRVATALVARRERSEAARMLNASEWVGEQYHPDWVIARGLAYGVGVHHGKVPRALSQFAVRAFNDGDLRFLVCTSTLIEGVNTKAKNVIIYDNSVARRKFDFFTFNNIRGRSGRMFHHFIGRVYLFNVPPQDDLPFVDIPIVNQDASTPESLLIQLEPEDLSEGSLGRIEKYMGGEELPMGLLRGNSGIDPDAQLRLARELRSNANCHIPHDHKDAC